MKRTEDSLRDLWNNIKHNNIRIIGVPEGEEREKGPKKIFEDIIVENFLTWERKYHPSAGSAESPRQDKHKEKHAETHNNQIGKIKDKEKLQKATMEK